MAKRSRKRKRDQQSVNNAPERIEDEARQKPTFVMEALEPRILLSATWVGTDHDDNFTGTNGADEAHGLAGHDVMHGGNGADILHGGDGNDHLYGGNQNDTLYGGAGDDVLDGGNHDDLLISGGGNDVMLGGNHNDTFQFTGAHDGDVITVDGGNHNDTIDLSGYSNNQVTDNGHSLTVDMGGGESFTVNYSNVEVIHTADGTYAPGSLPADGHAPTAVDDAATTTQDTAVTTHNVLANDSDPDGDTLNITGHTDGAHGTVDYHDDGTFTYTPEAGFHGNDQFHYTIDDGSGHSAVGTVDVTVNPADHNAAPTVVNDAATTVENTAVTTHNVLANDSDPDGDTLNIAGHTDGAHGTVDYHDDGTFTYTPEAGYHGNDSFHYTVDDGHGHTDTGNVDVTIAPVHHNAAPTVGSDAATTTQDVAVTTHNVLGNDSDPDGDALSITGHTDGAHGTVDYHDDGTFTYTPEAGFHGSDSFHYTVNDGHGHDATGTVDVTVDANGAPTVVNDAASTTEHTAVTTHNVLGNDSDPDGDALSITGHTDGAHGTVDYHDDGTFTYTPEAGFHGNDSFTYTVNDGHGHTDTGTVDVTVDPADHNAAPTVANDAASTTQDTAVTTHDVLANDSDPDGDALSITGHTDAAHGTVDYHDDGTFTYTPEPNFHGNDSFTYTVNDGHGHDSTGTVDVTVDPAPEAQHAPSVVDGSHADSDSSSLGGGGAQPEPVVGGHDPLPVAGGSEHTGSDDAAVVAPPNTAVGSDVGAEVDVHVPVSDLPTHDTTAPTTHVHEPVTDAGQADSEPVVADMPHQLESNADHAADAHHADTGHTDWSDADLDSLALINPGADHSGITGEDLGYYVNAAVGLAGVGGTDSDDDVHSQFEFDREFELPPTRASSDGARLDATASVEAGATAAETFQFVDADLDRAAGLNSQATHRRDPDASDDASHDESVQALQHDRGHTQSAQQRGGMGAKAGQWLAGLWGMIRGVGRRENEDK